MNSSIGGGESGQGQRATWNSYFPWFAVGNSPLFLPHFALSHRQWRCREFLPVGKNARISRVAATEGFVIPMEFLNFACKFEVLNIYNNDTSFQLWRRLWRQKVRTPNWVDGLPLWHSIVSRTTCAFMQIRLLYWGCRRISCPLWMDLLLHETVIFFYFWVMSLF